MLNQSIDACIDSDGTVTIGLRSMLDIVSGDL